MMTTPATAQRDRETDSERLDNDRWRVTQINLGSAVMLPAMSTEPDSASLRVEQATLRADQAVLRAERAELEIKKLEAEVAELRSRERETKQLRRFTLIRLGVDAIRWVMIIGASALPLIALQPIARDLAGQTSDATTVIYASMGCAALAIVGWIVTGIQSRLRKRKIKIQRERMGQLEQELKERPSASAGEGD